MGEYFMLQDNDSIWNKKNRKYFVRFAKNKNLFEDYKIFAEEYARFGNLVLNKIILSGHDNEKSDMWILPAIFLMRQSIELGLKALICRIKGNIKVEIADAFKAHKHNVVELFSVYIKSDENYLNETEKNWLKTYFSSINNIDKNSDEFRYPWGRSFESYLENSGENRIIDNDKVRRNLLQTINLIEKCLNCTKDGDFDTNLEPDFLIFTNDAFGNGLLDRIITSDKFHNKIQGYKDVINFMFNTCKENPTWSIYPLGFLCRNTIELCLKQSFDICLDHGVDEENQRKNRSHLLKKDLWCSIKPVIFYYAQETGEDLSRIAIADKIINELDEIDKKGYQFRYPTSLGGDYTFALEDKEIDMDNMFNCMINLIMFLDGCVSMLKKISENEA